MSQIFKVEIGDTFETKKNGTFEVISDSKRNRHYLIKFKDTGYIKEVRIDFIKSGYIKDWIRPSRFGVGYIGLGTYASFDKDGKALQCAVTWKSMLERCYCPKYQKKTPTYVGCTVAQEWHNYQVFAKWFYENYPKDNEEIYQLDKDFKVKGNKLYSPDTCTFLTKFDNIRISQEKDYIFVNPEGEVVRITNITEYCKERNLTRENMGKVHRGERPRHKGWTKYYE
jgi:hypothetical protein